MKRNNLYIIIIAFTISSCNNSNTKEGNISTKKNTAHLLNEKIMNFDTLFISYTDYEKEKSNFIGDSMKTSEIEKLPKSFEADSKFLGLYYCGTISLNDSTNGLIIRTPSTYVSSSIKLFIYDTYPDSIHNYFELAEEFGDEGNNYKKTCKIYKDKKSKIHFDFSEHHSSYDISEDIMVENYLLNYNCLLTKFQLDTIFKTKKDLKR